MRVETGVTEARFRGVGCGQEAMLTNARFETALQNDSQLVNICVGTFA